MRATGHPEGDDKEGNNSLETFESRLRGINERQEEWVRKHIGDGASRSTDLEDDAVIQLHKPLPHHEGLQFETFEAPTVGSQGVATMQEFRISNRLTVRDSS